MKAEERRKLNQKKNKLIDKLNTLQIKEEVLRKQLSEINSIFVEELFNKAKIKNDNWFSIYIGTNKWMVMFWNIFYYNGDCKEDK